MKKLMLKKRYLIISFIIILLILFTGYLMACSNSIKVKAENLMEGVKPFEVSGRAADDKYLRNTADFSIDLFKNSVSDSDNSLISPLSVMLALTMTANGADKQTLSQMETVLGKDIPLEELNQYLFYYVKNLPVEKKTNLRIANSIWFRDDSGLKINNDFLQKNANYYNADIYKSPFNNQTVLDINNWVDANTDGMIENIVDRINDDNIMYLINAVMFDATWKKVYYKNDVSNDTFTSIDGKSQTVELMNSQESFYLEDGKATGFMKPYYDNKYFFVALLPNEGISIKDYIQSLSGEAFYDMLNKVQVTTVYTALPKFSYDYAVNMNDALNSLGMPDAFSPDAADFSKLGASQSGNIYISEVLHKTFITVDELGTKAGAVTKVEMSDTAEMEKPKTVKLNRPFVFAIIDGTSKLPIFIGNVMSLGE